MNDNILQSDILITMRTAFREKKETVNNNQMKVFIRSNQKMMDRNKVGVILDYPTALMFNLKYLKNVL